MSVILFEVRCRSGIFDSQVLSVHSAPLTWEAREEREKERDFHFCRDMVVLLLLELAAIVCLYYFHMSVQN